MRVAVTSGRLGEALAAGLAAAGHDVLKLVERAPRGPDERRWEPAAALIDGPGLSDVDAVANVFEADLWRRWTPQVKETVRSSQITGTLSIVSHLDPDGRCQRFANLSSTTFFGDREDDLLSADSPAGKGWVARSTAEWEAAARHAPVSTVLMRTPMVLGVPGGAWERRRKGWLSGRFGHGRQWRCWIHVDDWAAAAVTLLEGTVEGPVVMAAPEPVRESAFAAALASVSGRWFHPPVPEALLKLEFGAEMTAQVHMASQRVVPRILTEEMGFRHRHPDLAAALADVT